MLAYKGFNDKLQATMGKGMFQFEVGKTYEEEECKCAKNGFHCAENPLCVLNYYSNMTSRFFIVEADGDVNQDGYNSRISCTKITLVKEISRLQLATHACLYIQKYPERASESGYVKEESGSCSTKDDFIIVRGKNPRAAGVKGSYLFLIKEKKKSREIEGIYPIFVDGEEIKENTFYENRGDVICERKN